MPHHSSHKCVPILYPLIITYRTDIHGHKVYDDYCGYVNQICHIDGILRDHAEILVFANIETIMQHRILTWSHFCHFLYGCCKSGINDSCQCDKALMMFRVKYFDPEVKAWCKYIVRQSDMNHWYIQYVKQIMQTKLLSKNMQNPSKEIKEV